MQPSWQYVCIILLWVFAIQFNDVISHFESDTTEIQHEKEGEKKTEKDLKIREWNEFLGLYLHDVFQNSFVCTLKSDSSLFHQWSPDIVIPPPRF